MILILTCLAAWVILILLALIFFKGAYMIDGCNKDCNQGRSCSCSKSNTPTNK